MNEQVPKSHSEIYHAVDGRLEFSPYNAERVLSMKLINGLGDLIPVRIFERDFAQLIQTKDEANSEQTSITQNLNSCVVSSEESQSVVQAESSKLDTPEVVTNEARESDTGKFADNVATLSNETDDGDTDDLSDKIPQDLSEEETIQGGSLIEPQGDALSEVPLEDDLDRDDSLATTLLGYQPNSLTPDEAKAEALIAQQDQEASSLMSHFKESLGAKQTHITSDSLPTGLDEGIRNRVTKTAEERQELLAADINQTMQADKEQIY